MSWSKDLNLDNEKSMYTKNSILKYFITMLKQLLNRIMEIKWISKDCPAEAAFVHLELVFSFTFTGTHFTLLRTGKLRIIYEVKPNDVFPFVALVFQN